MNKNTSILVSICCVSFNHEKYLEKCLRSFCSQKTNFKFEVLIHDDASTDRSQEIIKKVQNEYPDIIKPIFQTENQYSQGHLRIHSLFNYPRTKGKYIALCEGDDFWTDEYKLEKQVKLLEENDDCVLSFHANKFLFPDNLKHKNKIYRPIKRASNKYFTEDIIEFGGNFMHTGSMIFLKSALPPDGINWLEDCPVGDLPSSLYFSLKGNIIYCDDVMSAYRVFSENSWSKKKQKSLQVQKAHYYKMVKMWEQFNDYTNLKFDKKVQKAIAVIKHSKRKGIIKFYLNKLGLRP
ncbi:glycosyltransferase [Flavobacteriales bacterium]|jgi:glycosyltransferase involved in cell wall biosynthesis|nr:glycosyltransferase [Flavobacteriales bacterium]